MALRIKRAPTRPVTSRGQQTRQRILEAAEELFGERGYERTGVVDICQRAGVAQGTFYLYFTDKKATLIELVKELSHTLRREIGEAVRGIADRAAMERVGFRTFFTFVTRHRNLYRVVRQAEYVDEEIFRWYYRRLAQSYARGLAEAMGGEQIERLDPECLAYCLMGIGDFLGMRWVLWENQPPPDEIFEDLMNFILHGLSPRTSSSS
ncbi:MAG: TetR/AcrR family transcriptional regulator [Chloroflexi bacterium]|nr:TetR/AcrR family transcriptional regulator [Chloroflexota bacterium]MDA8189689.1 TetR/AcrR family transcriptional regulator [Dehalococcoidales bacterium]